MEVTGRLIRQTFVFAILLSDFMMKEFVAMLHIKGMSFLEFILNSTSRIRKLS